MACNVSVGKTLAMDIAAASEAGSATSGHVQPVAYVSGSCASLAALANSGEGPIDRCVGVCDKHVIMNQLSVVLCCPHGVWLLL